MHSWLICLQVLRRFDGENFVDDDVVWWIMIDSQICSRISAGKRRRRERDCSAIEVIEMFGVSFRSRTIMLREFLKSSRCTVCSNGRISQRGFSMYSYHQSRDKLPGVRNLQSQSIKAEVQRYLELGEILALPSID